MGPLACKLGGGAGGREEIPRDSAKEQRGPRAESWGVPTFRQGRGLGRARMLQGDWEGLVRVPGAGWQERVGIVGAKDRDDFTMELASCVRCHRETRRTSPLSKGSVDLVCGGTGDHRQSRYGETGPKARGVELEGEAPRAEKASAELGSGWGEPPSLDSVPGSVLGTFRAFSCSVLTAAAGGFSATVQTRKLRSAGCAWAAAPPILRAEPALKPRCLLPPMLFTNMGLPPWDLRAATVPAKCPLHGQRVPPAC